MSRDFSSERSIFLSGFSVRLKELRSTLDMKQLTIAKDLMVTQGAYSAWENGTREPPLSMIQNIANRYNVNTNWLVTGQGEMFNHQDDVSRARVHIVDDFPTLTMTAPDRRESLINGPLISVPYAGEIAAGEPAPNLCQIDYESFDIPYSLLGPHPDRLHLLTVNGHSMEPVIMHRDLVLIETSSDWQALNGRVVAARIDGDITLKELELIPDARQIALHPYNSHGYRTLIVDPSSSDIILLGRLHAVFRLFP